MGLSLLGSSCSHRPRKVSRCGILHVETALPNPDPQNFIIKKTERIGSFTIVLINYPDCTNYEGNKVLVYHGCNIRDVIASKKLDPHFCDECTISPIARFEPTERGWNWAKDFITSQYKRS